jgi:predicted DNA-binding protein
MSVRSDVSRMTIDIPKKSHKQLKALSVVLGKSMREIVIESIEDYLHS